MNKIEPTQLTDEQLLTESKRLKSSKIIRAVLIGFLIGVIVYGVAKGRLGFFALVPLYFIYLLIRASKKDREITDEIEKRGLK